MKLDRNITVTSVKPAFKCYQLQVCAELAQKSVEKSKDRVIRESALEQFLLKNATPLKTRQDPWLVFRYYRAQLVEAGILVIEGLKQKSESIREQIIAEFHAGTANHQGLQ